MMAAMTDGPMAAAQVDFVEQLICYRSQMLPAVFMQCLSFSPQAVLQLTVRVHAHNQLGIPVPDFCRSFAMHQESGHGPCN